MCLGSNARYFAHQVFVCETTPAARIDVVFDSFVHDLLEVVHLGPYFPVANFILHCSRCQRLVANEEGIGRRVNPNDFLGPQEAGCDICNMHEMSQAPSCSRSCPGMCRSVTFAVTDISQICYDNLCGTKEFVAHEILIFSCIGLSVPVGHLTNSDTAAENCCTQLNKIR